jgi:hypothetical protein
MRTTWHADVALLERYAAQELDDARVYSLETHLLACETCRAELAQVVDAAQLDRMWETVAESVDPPQPGVVERVLHGLGVRDHVARLLAATPSLRLSWFVAEAIALGFAVLAADALSGRGGRTDPAMLVFLIVAALLPVAGVAAAYGPGLDPTYEVGLAAPMRSSRLLLTRAAAVLGTSTVLAAVAALSLPTHDWTTAAWMLPSFGLTLACLALATWVRPWAAAVGVTFAWFLVAVIATYGRADRLTAFRGGGQLAFVLVIAVSAWVLARRRGAFDQGVVE